MNFSDSSVRLHRVTAGWVVDRPVFSEFSTEIEGPGLVQITGPNGSGKSTLVELMSGYLRPWAGRVLVEDSDSYSPAARSARRVVRTAPALFALMTVRDHLTLSAHSTGVAPEDQFARAKRLGLGPWFDENAGTLSSGSAQKLWYVFCTSGDFDLVVLDEPFNALDKHASQLVVDELNEWSVHKLVVLVAHHPPAGLAITRVIDLEEVRDAT